MTVFHLLGQADWEHARAAGEYAPPSLGTEGFIHFSTREQVAATARDFFGGRTELWLLTVEIPEGDAQLKWEAASPPTREGLFPHYYGALPLQYVRKAEEFTAR